ncbi:MAG: DUF6600 domain-containing protein [Pseudomonadota bacterium]
MTASTALSKPDPSSSLRWLPCVTAIALLGAHASALWAQVPLQQAPVQSSQAATSQIDPPGSIARLSLIEGAVSYAPGDAGNDNAWTAAQLNRPLTAGDRLWTGEQSRTEMHAGSTAIRLNSQTSLDLLALDDNTTQLRLSQGTVRLRVRQLFEGQRLEVDTPNLAFVISQPGDYRIDANPAANTTRVVAQSGAGVLYGDSGMPLNLGNQQQGNFTGTNLTPAAPGSAVLDSFDNWAMARDQREDQSVSARYVPRETVGYQQLDNYGDWSQDPSYGPVWLPRAIPANWAPYRAGHWSWIAPWGWTWVDDAPWGFAPFHYGRWAQIGPRWAWVPGHLQPRPVYAPALVAFIGGNLGGNSGGVNWSISLGSSGPAQPAVGWFPLAPGEAFRPAYRVSPRYVTRINNNIVVNNTVNVTNTTHVYRYQRQPAAVTAIAATDFARGQPVRSNVALNAADLGRAQVVDGWRGIPQRPDRAAMRDQARPVAAALPPPAATARPVVNLRDDRREDRREARDNDRQGNQRRDQPSVQPGNQAVSAAPPVAQAATPPAAIQRAAPQAQDNRAASNDENRVRREREQQRAAQRPPEHESLGQRALREQAQRERGDAMPPAARPQANQSVEQAWREQQKLQQEQQRLQREQMRQADRQQRQNEESIGQRALRDAAARDQQAAKQQEEARKQQQRSQPVPPQNQSQSQQPAQAPAQERNQQRQAHEQAQRQQQEQRKQQQQQSSEERQQSRKAEAAAREARNDGPAPPNRQQ